MLGAHAHERYSTHFVCVCVCPPFSGSIMSQMFIQHFDNGNRFFAKRKDFQLTDFSEKASFESYSLFCSFYGMAAIYFVDMLTQHIDTRFCKSVLL